MTEPHAIHPRVGSNVLLGAFLGALLAIVTAVFPASGFLLTPVLVVVLAVILVLRPVQYGRLVTFSGVLIGAGALYLYGVVNTVVACVGTSDFCGQANALPLFALAVVMLGSGGLLAAAAG